MKWPLSYLGLCLLSTVIVLGATWSAWNGVTVGSSAGNASKWNGGTIGTTAGNVGAWNGLVSPSSGGGHGANGFAYLRKLTWAAAQAGGSDSANFPGLINATEADWADTGHAGQIVNTVTQSGAGSGLTIPADFVVTTDSGCTSPLTGGAWEFEKWDNTTGAVILWINIATLSHTADTSVYACYGKSSITTQQNTVANVWDSNYLAVWHLGGTLDLHDSTTNANTLTKTSTPSSVAGQIGNGGASFSDSAYLSVSSLTGGVSTTTASMSAWVNASSLASFETSVTGTTSGQCLLLSSASGNPATAMWNGVSGEYSAATGLTVSTSAWHFWAMSMAASALTIYLDAANFVVSETAATNNLNQAYYVGRGSVTSRSWSGSLDEIRISKSVRSTDYLTARYNQEKASQTMVSVGAAQ